MTAPMAIDSEEEQRKKLEEQGKMDALTADVAPKASPDTGAGGGYQPPAVQTSAPQAPVQTATPSAVPPPPPPPPPSPPEIAGMANNVADFAKNWMANPNRYTSDLATATRTAGDTRLAKQEADSTRKIEEWAQSRGLVGSSYEGEQQRGLQADVRQQKQDEEAQLLQNMANSEALDRAAAGGYGLDVAKYQGTTGTTNRELDLKAQELQQQAATEGRTLDLQQARDQAGQEIELGKLGISRDDLTLRTQQVQQQAANEGRSLDLQQARDEASVQLTREGNELQARLKTDEMAQRESQFARSQGLSEREFVATQDNLTKQYAEQMAGRLQQDQQFKATLSSDDARAAVDAGLRQKALDLQRQGMTADQAFKNASLAQEKELALSAQRLTEMGISQENAYRYAALSQDARFKDEANRLQALGMTMDESFRQASLKLDQAKLDQQQKQYESELNFRMAQAKTDDERFAAMKELWDKYYGVTSSDTTKKDVTPPGTKNPGSGGVPDDGSGPNGEDPSAGSWVGGHWIPR